MLAKLWFILTDPKASASLSFIILLIISGFVAFGLVLGLPERLIRPFKPVT